MKRYRKLGILAAVLVVLLIAVFAVSRMETKKEDIQRNEEIILAIPADSVTQLAWTNDQGSFSLYREDGDWYWEDDKAFPVDKDIIEDLLGIFEELDSSFVIENVEDYGQYGLDRPSATISLTSDGKDIEIKLGDFSSLDEQRYMTMSDGTVYLLKEDPLDTFDLGIDDVICNDETPAYGTVKTISVKGVDYYTAEYVENSPYTYCPDDVYFTQRDGRVSALDSARVDVYFRNVVNQELEDFVTYNADAEDLKTYGLDDPEITVTVSYVEEDDVSGEDDENIKEFTFSLSRDADTRAQTETGEENEDKDDEESSETPADTEEEEEIPAYFRAGDSGIIYRVDQAAYERLMKAAFDDLRHQKIFTGSFADVTGISISLDRSTFTITSEEAQSNEKDDESGDEAQTKRVYYLDGEECSMEDFESALSSITASEFTDEAPSGREEISLRLYLDNENFPEVDIALYRYDAESCIAVLDGEPVAFVPRSNVVDLIEAVNRIIL